MIMRILVPHEAWLGMITAQRLAAAHGRMFRIEYTCHDCGKLHCGRFLSAHPEKLMVQILADLEP